MVKTNSPHVKALFILDSDGNRVCAKYYDKSYPTIKEQQALEKKLHLKSKNSTPRVEAEILLIENIISIYRSGSDTTMYIVGSSNENEIILLNVLDAAYETVSSLLKTRMDRHVMLDNIELVLLTFDEIVDGGVILEIDTPAIANRVLMRGIDHHDSPAELTISQAFATAREQFSRSFRSN